MHACRQTRARIYAYLKRHSCLNGVLVGLLIKLCWSPHLAKFHDQFQCPLEMASGRSAHAPLRLSADPQMWPSKWHQKGPHPLRLVFQQIPKCCPRKNTNAGPTEHRCFPTSDRRTSATSFLYLSVLPTISAVMLWSSVFRKFCKPLSTSVLTTCRPVVMSAGLSSLSTCLFHLTIV